MDGDIRCYGGCLDRGFGDFLAAAAWAVGLRDYGSDFDVRLREEMDESGDGEVRGAAENQTQGTHGAPVDAGESVRSFGRKSMVKKSKRHE